MSMRFTKEILLRARIVLLSVLLLAIAIVWKINVLLWKEGEQWRSCAKTNQLIYRPIKASRGNIYGDDGALLATTLPFYTVALDPTIASDAAMHQELDALCQKLAHFYGEGTRETYKKKIWTARRKKKRYVRLHAQPITHAEKQEMKQWPLFKYGKYKGGVLFEKQYIRYNPFKALAKRTIGTQRANGSSTGLEYAFDQELKGIDGQALYQKVIGGQWKEINANTRIAPIHGYDLETTLDINLQDVTQSSLLAVLEKTDAKHGCAVVMEVATGAVKAIANLSRMPSGDYAEVYNYAVGNQGTVEPGSVFKLASMLALLEKTHWPLTKPIDTGNGSIQYHNRWMRDVKKGGYGLLTLQGVFEKSSNVGISMAIQEVFGADPQQFIAYLEQLGLHKPLGIELVGEGKPYIVTPKSKMWHGVALPWLCIGYNLQITPLHILVLYNAVANNGKMVKPIFVRNIKAASGVIKAFHTTVLNEQICSEQTLHKLKTMLEGTVEQGLAQRIKHGFYKVAGKTGTAQKLVNGCYTDDHLTSFAGYFPADAPRYSCIIVVDSPQGTDARFGSEVPAPIFRNIVDRIAGKDLHARPPINGSIKPMPEPMGPGQVACGQTWSNLYRLLELPAVDKPMPQETQIQPTIPAKNEPPVASHTQPVAQLPPTVLHKNLRDALFVLEQAGFFVSLEGTIHGTVCQQSLKSHPTCPEKSTVHLLLK
ncbi:MAG TPA: penicillin-binding protein 2 [Amoebophilaceae bacterium]|nr:penicillin-binding protein 2 [Amoebophilaceae bacterium]